MKIINTKQTVQYKINAFHTRIDQPRGNKHPLILPNTLKYTERRVKCATGGKTAFIYTTQEGGAGLLFRARGIRCQRQLYNTSHVDECYLYMYIQNIGPGVVRIVYKQPTAWRERKISR